MDAPRPPPPASFSPSPPTARRCAELSFHGNGRQGPAPNDGRSSATAGRPGSDLAFSRSPAKKRLRGRTPLAGLAPARPASCCSLLCHCHPCRLHRSACLPAPDVLQLSASDPERGGEGCCLLACCGSEQSLPTPHHASMHEHTGGNCQLGSTGNSRKDLFAHCSQSKPSVVSPSYWHSLNAKDGC